MVHLKLYALLLVLSTVAVVWAIVMGQLIGMYLIPWLEHLWS